MANRSASDVMRLFHKALDLLSSSAPESEQELLDMVKKAKREQDREMFHPPKKQRTARSAAGGEGSRPKPAVARSAVEQAAPATVATPTKPTGVIRLGTGVAKGRVEKPKRKSAK